MGSPRVAAAPRAAEGFERHYASVYGERWSGLRTAVLDSRSFPGEGRIVRWNGFADEARRARCFEGLVPARLPGCHLFDRMRRFDERDEKGLVLGYVMNAASVLAARSLPLESARRILDMCAAPGGKALVLAERMPENAELVLNDRSNARRARLATVVKDYLPSRLRERIRIIGQDGRKLGIKQPAAYDAILLDAPCSSEAHVLRDEKALSEWSITRSKRLAQDQYALLTSALEALRPGGFLLYSTCALSPLENDGVVDRLLVKKRHPVLVEQLRFGWGEATKFGWLILPDLTGCGPLYFCLLRKP